MSISVETLPKAAYRSGRIFVTLSNRETLSFPIAGNWRLEGASEAQLNNVEIDDDGLHWPDVDEDLSFEGLRKGDYGQYVKRPE